MRRWLLTALTACVAVSTVSAQGRSERMAERLLEEGGIDLTEPLVTPFQVSKVLNVAYREGEGADPRRHLLDVFVPKDAKDFPILFFVHGGAWRSGSKDLYSRIGELFAGNGIGSVIINYRLSTRDSDVQHPAHIQDVARAFAWTVEHIGTYGGRADRIFAAGHSAGGHLVALLATDESYLKAEELSCDSICGVIPMSGVYAVLPDIMFPSVFGTNHELRVKAFPISHLDSEEVKLPPFLVIYADQDLPTIGGMSENFNQKLVECKVDAKVLQIRERNHVSLILGMMVPDDPLTVSVLDFIRAHAEIPAPLATGN